MTTARVLIRQEQAKRMEQFPEDRIPFYSSEAAANYDRYTFRHYMENFKENGFSEVVWACRELERSNYLPDESISPERFMLVAKSLGYDPYTYSKEEDEEP